jgi:two-component system, response regulator FlrC
MDRRGFFQRLGAVVAAGTVSQRGEAEQRLDPPAAPRLLSLDELRYARMVIGDWGWRFMLGVARVRGPVLITGEPGTGRTLAARLFHEMSFEEDASLLIVDCSRLVDIRRTCSSATRGTFVLENVTSLNLSEQTQVVEAMWHKSLPGCRVVCTASTSLRDLAEAGLFSEELYYRMNLLPPLELDALRERPKAILPLAEHMATREAAVQNKVAPHITPQAADVLRRHRWPGNVRELERVMARAVGRAQHNPIRASDVILESRSA